MKVRVRLHGLLLAGIESPEGIVEADLPPQSDVAALFEALAEIVPMLDARACLAVVNGVKVSSDHILQAGDEVGLYHLFSGG